MSAKKTGYKWSKFYWDDWRNDASLQSCDLATKGLWMDLLSLMFSSERQGYLQSNNKPMSLLYISKKTGVDKRTIEKKLKVLIENNVCSVDENGVVFSRRMARETKSPASLQDTSSKDTVSIREVSRKVPVNLQEEIAENSQKQESPIIDKNRIDIEKKESNPPKSPLKVKSPPDDKSILFNESVLILSQITGLAEEKCRPIVGRWLKQLGGNAEMLVSLIDKGLLANVPIPYISKMVSNAVNVHHSRNVTYLPQRKTNKQQMTEAWGLCESLTEFEEKYGDEEPTLEQLNSHNPNRAWG